MARRGFGGTALRAALGAVSGVTEGLQQREILAAQRKQQEEINALNRFNALRAAGFGATLARSAVPQEERETFALPSAEMPASAMSPSAMGQALAKATQADFGVSSRPTGALDTPIRLALETAPRRMAQAQPAATPRQRITLGGMDLELETPEEVAQREQTRKMSDLEKQFEIQQKVQEASAQRTAEFQKSADEQRVKTLVLAGVPEAQARAAVTMGAKFGDLMETPESRRRAELDARNLNLRERQYALEVAKYNLAEQDRATKLAESQDKKKAAAESLQNVLPTISSANKKLNSWTDKELNQLSAEGVNAAMVANMSSTTPSGIITSWMLNKTLVSPLDREYAQYARATADAVARASEVGVLTNQDIARYQNQVTFVAGDDPETKRRKFEALKTWGSWLENNKKSLVDGNRRSIAMIPGETPTEALARLRGGQ